MKRLQEAQKPIEEFLRLEKVRRLEEEKRRNNLAQKQNDKQNKIHLQRKYEEKKRKHEGNYSEYEENQRYSFYYSNNPCINYCNPMFNQGNMQPPMIMNYKSP